MSSCVFCSGSVGGFTFAHLSKTKIKHLTQASFGVLWLTFFFASAGKEGEAWRMWSRNETGQQI